MPAENESYPSVFARPPRRRREQPALSREQIVSEAIRLLDEEGIDALSMRRLGARLGAVATAIYWHVENKDDLLELVVDEIYGEIELPEAGDPVGWRAAMFETAQSTRTTILRHPWIASLLGEVGLSALGPHVMRMSERVLLVLKAAGFPLIEADRAMNTIMAYVLGIATSEAAAMTKLARQGQSEQQWVQSPWPQIEELTREHPLLLEVYTAWHGRDPGEVNQENFDYGLNRILDGLAARLG